MGEKYIFPFFWLHGESEEKLREYVNVIADANCGALCVESRPHPDFCGEKWWQDMDVILDEAKKRGVKIWILDDSHFPTGFANGAAMRAKDELRRQSVYTKVYEIKPGTTRFTCCPDREMKKAIQAIPKNFMQKMMVKTDKDAKHPFTDDRLIGISALIAGEKEPRLLLDENGAHAEKKICITLPEHTSKVYLTFLTRNCGIHKSYMNMMDRESCRLLIEEVYEKHYAHYKDEFGKTILGFFSDEPELGNGVYFKNDIVMGSDMDFPWSRELEAKMPEVLGKDWKSLLPLVWDEGNVPEVAAKVRFQYMNAVTRLVETCFSRQIGTWCAEHGVSHIGHVIEDGNAHARTANSLGHYFRGLSGQSMAGIDDIGGQVLPYQEDAPAEGIFKMLGGRDGEFYHFMLGKLAASMAAIQPEKKGRSMCEIFGNYGWGEGSRMEKYLADHFMVQGINHFVPHAFSPKEYPDKDCPPHFYANGHNPQYRAFGQLIQYMNRVCKLISDGKPVTETAILYHADAEWMGKTMLDQKPARVLMEHQVDFHIVPSDVFEERERYQTRITEEGLEVNGNVYKVFLIPYAQYIHETFAKALEELAETSCRICFLEGRPEAVIAEDEKTALPLGEKLKKLQVVQLSDLPLAVSREMQAEPENKRLRAFHYKKENQELYYFVNEDDRDYEGSVTVPGMKYCYAFDAWTGEKTAQKFEQITPKSEIQRAEQKEVEKDAQPEGCKTRLYLCLRPGESRIVLVGKTEQEMKPPLYEEMKELEKAGITSEGNKTEENRTDKNGITPFAENWKMAVCKATEYPAFTSWKEISKFEDYAKVNKKFSGYLAYKNQFHAEPKTGERYILSILDAGEDVEVFVNEKSAGIQILPPFLLDITEFVKAGTNDIRIEVATTLERERGVNKKKQQPVGLLGDVVLYQIGNGK